MILLYCCCYVFEEPSQCGDEICVVVRVACMLTHDGKTVAHQQCIQVVHTRLSLLGELQAWLMVWTIPLAGASKHVAQATFMDDISKS